MSCKHRHLKIYEAGKMSGLTKNQMLAWRIELKDALANAAWDKSYTVQVINPVEFYDCEYADENRQSEFEAEDFDLHHVKTSDLIVVNLDGLATSDGSKIELHDANYNNRIPVIAFGDKDLYDTLHPWIKRNITRVEKDIEGVVKYVTDFYMI